MYLLTILLTLLSLGHTYPEEPPFDPLTATLQTWQTHAQSLNRTFCYIYPTPLDSVNIPLALNDWCSSRSLVIFPGPTYHIDTVMNTTLLDDVHIYMLGTFLWSTNITHWLKNTMPMGFQNQSTVWFFGGKDVILDGLGRGTLDGNGQVWYDWARDRSNLAHRPMMINWRGLRNSIIRRINFVQSQMWAMATTWSEHLLFEDIYVNNTSSSEHGTVNTDGVDTIYSNNITFSRWDITCGDDAIALKGNSSNIFVYDSIFRGGQGLAIGSLGQFKDQWEYVDNFHGRNITMYDTRYGIFVKTWSGEQNGYPPNGGGGGKGHASGIIMEYVTLHGTRQAPIWLWQCEHYEGSSGDNCHSSEFSFSGLEFKGFKGTVAGDVTLAASLKCSNASEGCIGIEIDNFEVTTPEGEELTDWFCSNAHATMGFECEPFPEDVGLEGMAQ